MKPILFVVLLSLTLLVGASIFHPTPETLRNKRRVPPVIKRSILQTAPSNNNNNGAYVQWGSDASGSNTNPNEHTLTKQNVGNLKPRSSFTLPGTALYTGVTVKNGILYTTDGFFGDLYALDATTLQPISTFNGGQPITLGVGPAFYNAGCNTAYANGYIIACIDTLTCYSFNATTGVYNPHWPAYGSVNVSVYEWVAGSNLGQAQGEFQASVRVVSYNGRNLVLLTTSSSSEVIVPSLQKGVFWVFDADTGATVCTRVIGNADSIQGNGVGGWSTAAVAGRTAFFGTSNPQAPPAGPWSDSLQAVDILTCALVWNTQFVADDVSGQLYPIGLPDANGNWKSPYMIDKDMGGSPSILPNGMVGLIGKDGVFHARRQSDGQGGWDTALTATPMSLGNPSSAVQDNTVYVAYSSDVSTTSFGPNASYPVIDYTTQITGYGGAAPGSYESSPSAVYYLSRILQGQWNATSTVAALNAGSGAFIWQHTVPTCMFGSPFYANGMLFTAHYDGSLRVWDAGTGAILYNKISTAVQAAVSFSGPGTNMYYPLLPNYGTPVGPVVVNGMVYIVSTSMSFAGSAINTLSL
jgi:hypothetical protein